MPASKYGKKTILLSYSRSHFDPDKTKKEQPYWGSSANIIARTLYSMLMTSYDVTYIDPSEVARVKGKRYDFLIGQVLNFDVIMSECDIGKGILVGVNMHPVERNNLIKEGAKALSVPLALADHGDLVDPRPILAAIKTAESIVCVGNEAVYNSYIRHGVSRRKVKMINYSTGPIVRPRSDRRKSSGVKRYLYMATEIGLRKGFDAVDQIARYMAEEYSGQFHLDIIGGVNSDYHKTKLSRLQTDLRGSITYYGWLETNSQGLEDAILSNDFLLFPSLEEGQAGSVLDSIRRGLVPIVSQSSGINYSPLGFLKPSSMEECKQIIDQAQQLTSPSLAKLSSSTLDYYNVNHGNFNSQIEEAVLGAITGELYPRISITLAIFNKEGTIKELLSKLYRAATTYGNAELQIIFDGCLDRSEEVTKEFFAKHREVPVHFYETPNIFEVKSNNIGLKNSKGKYCVIVQDDNFINNPNCFTEAVNFLDKNSDAAILGGLAGVNFYPRGTRLVGSGQISMTEKEVYWRQDGDTDKNLHSRVFQVDACMRGPLFIRRDFLVKHGYLDEVYAPLYNDDMDLCFRAKKLGLRTYCMLMDVENRSETIANYDSERNNFWEKVISKNSDIFYSRWKPDRVKDYAWQSRIRVYDSGTQRAIMRYDRVKLGLSTLANKANNKAFMILRRAKHVVTRTIKQSK